MSGWADEWTAYRGDRILYERCRLRLRNLDEQCLADEEHAAATRRGAQRLRQRGAARYALAQVGREESRQPRLNEVRPPLTGALE